MARHRPTAAAWYTRQIRLVAVTLMAAGLIMPTAYGGEPVVAPHQKVEKLDIRH